MPAGAYEHSDGVLGLLVPVALFPGSTPRHRVRKRDYSFTLCKKKLSLGTRLLQMFKPYAMM